MQRAVIIAAAAIAVVAVYVLRFDQAAGLYVDDAWYIVLAKAVWQGDGFRLISSATTPILPAFPPGFALILAPVIGAFPEFPANVTPLKLVSLAAMCGVGVATYRYVVRNYETPAPVGATVAVITVLMPAFVFLATSTVMAEATFTFAQLCFALSAERTARRVSGSPFEAVGCGLIAGATLLIRLAGIASIAAGVGYLAWRREWRSAAVVAAVAAACYAPWALYSAANRETLAERVQHGGSIAYGYDELLLMRYGGEPGGGRVTLQEMPGRISFNAMNIFGRDTGAFVLPAAYREPIESGLEAFLLSGETGFRATGIGGGNGPLLVSLPVSAIMLAGFVRIIRRRATVAEWMVPLTIAMVVLVPARTFRYVLPLAPFLLFYFFCGLEAIAASIRRHSSWTFGAPFRVAASCVLALIASEHIRYIYGMHRGPQPVWLRDYEEATSVTDWVNANLHDDSPIASSNPGLIYLATGRKTVALSDPRIHLSEWHQLGVRYAVAVHVAEKPSGFETLYESPRLKLWVLELPAPLDRK